MEGMKRLPRPTASELAILGVLWRRGPSTVRQVLNELDSGAGYTTVLKLMQIMADKGLAIRDEAARSHVYRATVPEGQTLGGIVGDLLDRAFGGSSQKLLVAALSAKRALPRELEEMRRLIEQAQQKNVNKPSNREQS
jgi:predicted transcriptional regulator